MRVKRREWANNGKDIENCLYNEHKEAKRIFRHKHRFYAENYLCPLNDDLDKAVDLDPGTFWRLNGNRMGKGGTQAYQGAMKFNNHSYRNPGGKAKQWGGFFQ